MTALAAAGRVAGAFKAAVHAVTGVVKENPLDCINLAFTIADAFGRDKPGATEPARQVAGEVQAGMKQTMPQPLPA